jgi:hypothetical protein
LRLFLFVIEYMNGAYMRSSVERRDGDCCNSKPGQMNEYTCGV